MKLLDLREFVFVCAMTMYGRCTVCNEHVGQVRSN